MIVNSTEFFLMNNPLREIIQERYEVPILRHITIDSGSFHNALEIGYGSGKRTRLIKKYFEPMQIEAIDLDERMISKARKRNRDRPISFRV